MRTKQELSIEMQTLLRQLVVNGGGGITMAVVVLQTYCRRMYQVEDETASRWATAYLHREFPQQLKRYREKAARA